jgi:hypothetical protein
MRYLLLALFCLFALPAKAAETAPFTATYGLYTGGVRMIEVTAKFDLQPASYVTSINAKTVGLFSKLLPWSGKFDTTGVNPGYKPSAHNYAVTWMGNVDKATFAYDPPGEFKSMTQTKKGVNVENPAGADIAAGTRDLLSTVLVAFRQFDDKGTCAGDILTFDNARSFIVRFADAGETELNNDKLSAYTGPAHACTVEIIPQKGKWPKKPRGWLRIQQQAKEGGRLPVLWLASPRPGLPAIPVRVDIHTKYGDVIAHLTAVQ